MSLFYQNKQAEMKVLTVLCQFSKSASFLRVSGSVEAAWFVVWQPPNLKWELFKVLVRQI